MGEPAFHVRPLEIARTLSRFDRQKAAGAALPPRGRHVFQSTLASFFTSPRSPSRTALPGDAFVREPGPRERHAQALAYAGRRRRAAQAQGCGGPDLAYWKAGVPLALARAASIRAEPCFSRLP